jgi:hypothetical protein
MLVRVSLALRAVELMMTYHGSDYGNRGQERSVGVRQGQRGAKFHGPCLCYEQGLSAPHLRLPFFGREKTDFKVAYIVWVLVSIDQVLRS